ncbi:MAG: hypothetical protein IKA30_02015, partial [Alphaproteobacteria bacterium]|nr:hypothetical protein [Alphaproteobacteria bacterium]
MNTRILTTSLLCLIGFSIPSKDAYSRVGRLNPKDFNQMYHLATLGKVGNLRNAVNRGLNIDATNPNVDTGLCIAVKRKNYIAYNSFRMSGANPRHPCTYKIYNEYQEFLNSTKTVREERILGNKESLYYNEKDAKVWPWVLGVAAIGGGALALSGGGGGSSPAPVIKEDHITPIAPQTGLTGYITNYHTLVENDNITNILDITYDNNTITDPNTIQLLPNALDMSSYLSTFALAKENSTYDNWGTFSLSDGVVGLSAHGTNSIIKNNGNINISAVSGSIGMAASNGGTAYNGSQDLYSDDNGNINLSSKGATTGNSLIGMYADTNSKIINYGKITATTSETKEDLNNSLTADFIILPDLPLGDEEENQDNLTPDTPEDTEDPENTDETTPNAGTLVGMSIFNFYTGTNLSANTVSATNHGNIELSAGYNTAQEVGVSLVGMGSYIDDKFLNQNHNPAYAEQMELNNSGNINLKYQGKYKLSKDALKLGKGGLIGIRADAQGKATNKGSININLTSTTLEQETDSAAEMLSVHGAELINGDATNHNPLTSPTSGHIIIINDAT